MHQQRMPGRGGWSSATQRGRPRVRRSSPLPVRLKLISESSLTVCHHLRSHSAHLHLGADFLQTHRQRFNLLFLVGHARLQFLHLLMLLEKFIEQHFVHSVEVIYLFCIHLQCAVTFRNRPTGILFGSNLPVWRPPGRRPKSVRTCYSLFTTTRRAGFCNSNCALTF